MPIERIDVEPFLRWAGGKRQILNQLLAALPRDLHKWPYHEPFLGAGSLFFAARPSIAYLSDANKSLIEVFKSVRGNPSEVHRALRKHGQNHTASYYYKVREVYNKSTASASQAARFIYLNKACFNGIFRVNSRGQFNVPVGDKVNLALPTLRELKLVSQSLQRAKIKVADYKISLDVVENNHFVYLDPPYPPLNTTAYFTHYTVDRFDSEAQMDLAKSAGLVDMRGAKFLMSNADTPAIRKLYKGFNIQRLPVVRFVTCKSKRTPVWELLIRNY